MDLLGDFLRGTLDIGYKDNGTSSEFPEMVGKLTMGTLETFATDDSELFKQNFVT